MAMPSARAWPGFRGEMGTPLRRISPPSATSMPARIFPKVLLPAPFSPIRAWQLPSATEKDTSESA